MQQAEMRHQAPAVDREGFADNPLSNLSFDPRAFVAVFMAEPMARIEALKAGVPANVMSTLSEAMDVSRDLVYRWTGIPRATGNRKVKNDENLSLDEGERVLGLVQLVGQVQKIVDESGDPAGFDAARWTASWLEAAHDALGGRTPGELMDTGEGRALVSSLVGRMQSGTYM